MNGGRPVLKVKAKNLVPLHNKQIVISYSFSRARMLVEPMLIVGTIFALFAFFSIVSRLDADKHLKVPTNVKNA